MAQLTGSETFLSLGLTSPDDTGSAEHRAIYDLLVDCFDTGSHAYADDMGDDPVEYAYGMLNEVISWAQEMRRQITIAQRDAQATCLACNRPCIPNPDGDGLVCPVCNTDAEL